MDELYIVETVKKQVGHEQMAIIKSVFENSDERPIHGIERKSFRSRNPQWMDVLSSMESAQLLIKNSQDFTRLRLSVFALPLLDHPIAEQYLDLMDELVPTLDSLYQKVFDKPIQIEKLRGKFPNIGETLFKNVIFYLSEIGGILQPVSAEQLNESTQLIIDERIRKIRSARERIYEIYTWHFKNINIPDSPKIDQKEISLVGTWDGELKDIANLSRRIMENKDKKAAIWWSFVIDKDVQKRLKKPFFIYINFKPNTIKFRLRVVDFSSVSGNAGHPSPWPEYTLPHERNISKSGISKNHIFKTWFLIEEVLQFNKPMTIESFEPARPWSNIKNVLNQNAFGYAYIKSKYSTISEAKNASIDKSGYIVAGIDSATEEDSLGRVPLASALAAMLSAKEQESPFTFAILGEWGSGKSSLIQMILKRLKEFKSQTFEFAEFNAWAYESCPNMAAALAQEIISGLVKNKPWYKEFWLSLRYAYHSKSSDLFVNTVILAASITSVIVLTIYLEGFLNSLAIYLGISATIVILLLYYKFFLLISQHPLTSYLRNFISLPKLKHHLGLTAELKDQITLLCELTLKGSPESKRLIIFIDDLDRCRPSQILNVLEAVNLVANLKNVFVILAIDPRILIDSAKYFQRETNNGTDLNMDILARDYLGKIFQLLVSLDEPGKNAIDDFISGRLFHNLDNSESINIKGASKRIENILDPILSNITPDSKRSEENSTSILDAEFTVKNNESSNSFKFLPNTADEKLYFIENSELFGIKNPRQLIRLHNSYNLLKILSPDAFYADGGNSLIKILFFKEFLQKFKREEQETIENYILDKEVKLDSIKVSYELIETIKREIGEGFSSFNDPFEINRFIQLSRFVNRFIIPLI